MARTTPTTVPPKPTNGRVASMPPLVVCLGFDDQCEEAVNHYVSIFPNSRIVHMARGGGPMPVSKDKVLQCVFELNGQTFHAMDGGPQFTFEMGFSMVATCNTQADLDRVWGRLLEGGGKEQQCGWLKDRFGVSWQVIPKSLGDMMSNPKGGNTTRLMEELLTMVKLDAKRLEDAYHSGKK